MTQFVRGDVVVHRPDGMFVVWSETLGVVHCMPAAVATGGTQMRMPGATEYLVRVMATCGDDVVPVWVDADTRRHFRRDGVVKRGDVQHAGIGAIGAVLLRQAQDFAAEDQSRRDGVIVAALVRQRDRAKRDVERLAA